MSKFCMIETAFDKKEELELVVDELFNKKLIASLQVVESNSKWIWRNKLENAKEYLVLMKTKKELVKKIFETIKKFHSYECFEFAIFEIGSCNEEYLKWIDDETFN